MSRLLIVEYRVSLAFGDFCREMGFKARRMGYIYLQEQNRTYPGIDFVYCLIIASHKLHSCNRRVLHAAYRQRFKQTINGIYLVVLAILLFSFLLLESVPLKFLGHSA